MSFLAKTLAEPIKKGLIYQTFFMSTIFLVSRTGYLLITPQANLEPPPPLASGLSE